MGKQSRLEKKKQAKSKRKLARKSSPMAAHADRHELYQKSVQDTDVEIELMLEKYRDIRGREPVSFREDFCGTALLSVAWCQGNKKRTAQGVDLCKQTLAWGREHNLTPAGDKIAARVELLNDNVLKVHKPKVDMTCAFNFSYSVFKTRDDLCRYFKSARKGLNEDGVLMLDIFGGTEAIRSTVEKRKVEGEPFKFIWEQEKYNPVTNEILCHINFKFKDGSSIEPAFTYDWRLWTIPELHELLLEAGFSRVHVYWEEYKDDEDDEGYLVASGDYIEVSEVENQDSWVSYILAEV